MIARISSHMSASLGNLYETSNIPILVTFVLLIYIYFILFKFKGCDMLFEPRGVRNGYSTLLSTDEGVTMERVTLPC